MSTWKAPIVKRPAANKKDAHYPRAFAASVRTAHSRRSYKALEAVKEAK